MLPRVSVIIPNYNCSIFLTDRMISVLSQSYSHFECIVLDDASADNSLEIINRHAINDKRVSIIASSINSGSPFIQWNKGVKHAIGEFIWIAESDDVADVTFLETMVRQLDNNPCVGLAYCQSYKIDKHGKVTGSWKEWTDDIDKNIFERDFVMDGKKYIEQFLIHRNTIPNASGVLFRKSVYNEINGANENIRNCSDWLTWLKILVNYDVAFVAQPLNFFRYREDSVISKAHVPHNNAYEPEFDYFMRKSFNGYLLYRHSLISKIKKLNDYFIFHAIGNYGLHNFKNGKKLKGLLQILRASWHPVITLNFIKRLLN